MPQTSLLNRNLKAYAKRSNHVSVMNAIAAIRKGVVARQWTTFSGQDVVIFDESAIGFEGMVETQTWESLKTNTYLGYKV